jgi:ribonuclease J
VISLTFYGGVNEIGGNKVLLEDDGRRLLLDFGFPFKGHKLFYEEYISPRSGAGLLDPLTMGLLPPLEGLYRDDLAIPGIWQRFQDNPAYRKLGPVDGVLLSHAHLDHSGYISFLGWDIPVYATAMTAFITKAIQDSGRANFDQQACYSSPVEYGYPSGWKQQACLTAGSARQRQFCIADINPQGLAPEAIEFWNQGFWEKTARQKGFVARPLVAHTESGPGVKCFPVDHSIPGACAWAIETSSGWIVYSGDLRLHGKRLGLTRRFIEQAAALKPRALILEGTNVLHKTNISEQKVYETGLEAISGSKGLVIADFSPRDVDRLLTFLQIARDTGRKLAILPRDAYLLKAVRLLEPETPDIAVEDNIVIYQGTGKSNALWLKNIFKEYESKLVLADEVSSVQEQFILCFSFFDLNELPSIRPRPGSLYVFSSSEPHDEEQEIDFRRLHNWLRHFKLRSFGLPLETDQGWQVPAGQKGLHASGHACGTDLLQIAGEISPQVLIPIHSLNPAFFSDHLSSSGISVMLPVMNGTIELWP